MDDSYLPASEVVRRLVEVDGEIVDHDAGIRFWIDRLEIDAPVELSISRDPDGRLQIGSTPPLYYVDTTFRPSYHRIRVTAVARKPDGE
jgi:hypothetical protein